MNAFVVIFKEKSKAVEPFDVHRFYEPILMELYRLAALRTRWLARLGALPCALR